MTEVFAGVFVGIILLFFILAWGAGMIAVFAAVLAVPATIYKNITKKP